MRFAPRADRSRSAEPVDRLVRRTRLRLAAVTLLLVACLLGGVGLVTAAVATGLADAGVDRSLRGAATTAMSTLFPEPDDTSPAGGTPTPGESADANEPAAANDSVAAGESPAGSATASPATPGTPAAATAEIDDHPPESSDTFFLVLDPGGTLTSNPRRVALEGLPDQAAVAAARTAGEDWRTVTAGGVRVRLLTQAITDQAGTPAGFLQSGFVLTLHDEQTRELLGTILAASVIGLVGAALVTLLVTRRALAPIRSAFATERRFVAAASHELRTPVAIIRASAEILQREGLVAPEGRSTVDDVITESDRLSRLVGDLLALASAEAGDISFDPRPVEIHAFIADLARRVAGMVDGRGAHLVVDDPSSEPSRPLTVRADPDRLTQILLIFIDNAVDHSPEGGVVRVVVRKGENERRPAVTVSVIDQGPGVPGAERDRIFEPFARLPGRPRTIGGTGLGLAIARLLANRLDATLRVDDAPGGGAMFSVVLPQAQEHPLAGG